MAKYVLLQFDEDRQADDFVEQIQKNGSAIMDDHGGGVWSVSATVRAVFKKPTKFCDCKGVKNRGFTRGKKFGWWVCAQCGKPTPAWAAGAHWFMALGKNLLPVDNRAPEYRGDGVFARHYGPCTECGTTLVCETGMVQAKVWCPKCEAHR